MKNSLDNPAVISHCSYTKQLPKGVWAHAVYKTAFLPDGKRVADIVLCQEKCNLFAVIFVDGQMKDRANDIDMVTFSPDGRRIGYVLSNDLLSCEGQVCWVVVDSNKYGAYSGVSSEIIFSGDSAHFAYVAKETSERAGKIRYSFFIVLDGTIISEKFSVIPRINFEKNTVLNIRVLGEVRKINLLQKEDRDGR